MSIKKRKKESFWLQLILLPAKNGQKVKKTGKKKGGSEKMKRKREKGRISTTENVYFHIETRA